MSKDKKMFYIVGNGMYLGEGDKMYYDTEKARVFTEELAKDKVEVMGMKNPSLYFYYVDVEKPEETMFYVKVNNMYVGKDGNFHYTNEKAKKFPESELEEIMDLMSFQNPLSYVGSIEVEDEDEDEDEDETPVEKPEVRISGDAEDKIYAAKKFNNELQKVMDERYELLKRELKLAVELEEYLFDYVYNETEEIMFEEYLAKYGKKFEKYIHKG
jgi:hypothetical protein